MTKINKIVDVIDPRLMNCFWYFSLIIKILTSCGYSSPTLLNSFMKEASIIKNPVH